jgi:hypothetical protein
MQMQIVDNLWIAIGGQGQQMIKKQEKKKNFAEKMITVFG